MPCAQCFTYCFQQPPYSPPPLPTPHLASRGDSWESERAAAQGRRCSRRALPGGRGQPCGACETVELRREPEGEENAGDARRGTGCVRRASAGERKAAGFIFRRAGCAVGQGRGEGSSLTGGGQGWESHGWTDSHKEKVGDFLERIFLLDFDLSKEGRHSQFVP